MAGAHRENAEESDEVGAEPTIARRLANCAIAGLLTFIVTEGAIRLLLGPYEAWGVIGAIAAVPSALLTFVRFKTRLVAFVLGLLVYGAGSAVFYGPHNPFGLIPALGACSAWGALLAETVVRAHDFLSRHNRRLQRG